MWATLAGVVAGAGGTLAASAWRAEASSGEDCCGRRPARAGASCPARRGKDGFEVIDRPRVDRLRRALRDGVYRPWVKLGRAPTPAEVAAALHAGEDEAWDLLDELEACGEEVGVGILRVPESETIATAWPFSNVPTEIVVRVDGGPPVYARCAYDSLGISRMLGKRVEIEAQPRDGGAPLRFVVDGDRYLTAPAGAVLLRGGGCDDMTFFTGDAAARAWLAARKREGKIFTLDEALARASAGFGRITEGLPE